MKATKVSPTQQTKEEQNEHDPHTNAVLYTRVVRITHASSTKQNDKLC